jgi:DNA-binding response OmpR family regulator
MPRKILVVDDKLFMVRLIQHHLERAGFQLIKARNRQEAMEAIAQQSPELVVLDESGNSPAQAKPSLQDFQPHQSEQNIPVIRMTDVPQDADANVTAAEVILTKPFSPTHLVAEVKRLMPEP